MRDNVRGIQSVEVGGRVLMVLMNSDHPMTLKEVAEAATMPSSSVYPYLVSLCRIGLVDHDKATGRYDLGSFSMQLGVASMGRLDSVKIATEGVVELALATGKYVALSVWGGFGPTVIRIEDGIGPLYLNMRIGTVMSMTRTATGRVFATYLPRHVLERFVEEKSSPMMKGQTSDVVEFGPAFEGMVSSVRNRGFDRAVGVPVPGAHAFCAPVFDYTGHLAFAVTIMGPEGEFDYAWSSPLAAQLLESTRGISQRLGYLPGGT